MPQFPKIFDVQINGAEVTEEVAIGSVITLIGANFSDTSVYIDKKEVADITVVDEQTLSFVLPESYLTQGKKKIQVISKNRFFKRKSNTYTLEITQPIDIALNISNATIEKISDISQIIHINGENFDENSSVFINGIQQTNVLTRDASNISVKIETPQWTSADEFNITVSDNNALKATTNEYILSNESKIDALNIRNNINYLKDGYLVAHAFGGLEEQTYTNSMEAFLYNYERGHRIFEVDFQFSSDDVLITLRNRDTMMQTYDEEASELLNTIMSFRELCDLMLQYDDIFIITDTKYDRNYHAIKSTFDYMTRIINSTDRNLFDRIIIQIYNQSMYYFLAENYNFPSYIYTLYMSSDTNAEVLDFVNKTGIPVITMPIDRATKDFIDALNNQGIYSFVHTVNDTDTIYSLLEMGVYGIYTDFISYDDLLLSSNERYASFISDNDKKQMQLHSFIKDFKIDSKGISVISMTGANRMELPDDLVKLLRKSGLELPLFSSENENYLAVINNDKIVFEEVFSGTKKYSWRDKDVFFDVIYNDNSQLVINNIKHSIPKEPNIITYDIEDNNFNITLLNDSLSENSYTSFFNSRNYLLSYLDEINKLKHKYIIILSVKDEASSLIDDEIQKKLANLGLSESLNDKYRWGYAGVIDSGNKLFEVASPDLIENFMIAGEYYINVKSAGGDSQNISSITIDGIEYSKNMRGINIVLFDKTIGQVVDSVCFDTCEGLNYYS